MSSQQNVSVRRGHVTTSAERRFCKLDSCLQPRVGLQVAKLQLGLGFLLTVGFALEVVTRSHPPTVYAFAAWRGVCFSRSTSAAVHYARGGPNLPPTAKRRTVSVSPLVQSAFLWPLSSCIFSLDRFLCDLKNANVNALEAGHYVGGVRSSVSVTENTSSENPLQLYRKYTKYID